MDKPKCKYLSEYQDMGARFDTCSFHAPEIELPHCNDCKIIEKEKSSGKLLGTETKQTYIGDLPFDPIELIKSNDEINFENSLNAEAGRYRHRDPQLSYYLERAQWTIAVLSKYIEKESK